MGLHFIKNGTKHDVCVKRPSLFPASATTYDNSQSGLSATRVQGAIDELANGTVLATVVADGVKTNSALLGELLATANGITSQSRIVEKITSINLEIVFHAVTISPSLSFTKTDVRTDRTVIETITYSSGVATMIRGDITSGGLTVTVNSSNVPTVGTTFTLYK